MPSQPPEDESLREVLAASEARKAAEWQRARERFNRILLVGLPAVVLVVVATVLVTWLGRDKATEEIGAASPLPSADPASGLTDQEKFMANLRFGGDGANQAGGTSGGKPGQGELLDKHDVQFAIELLEFMQAPAKPQPGKR